MLKGNHSQGYGKAKQRKGRWELRSSAHGLQVKGTTTHRTQSIRDQESKATDLGEGGGGEFGWGQNNILT